MTTTPTVPTGAVAALALVLGYLVADLTGVRALGGVLLLVGLVVCAVQWRRRVGTGRTVLLVGVFVALFVVSHLLARAVGAWPSVLTVAAVMWAVAFAVADRREHRSGSAVPPREPAHRR